jgi:hydrogenase maturation protein HypF
MHYWELHITGQVQGVGFRPRVYDIAHQHGLRGSVSNGMDGLRIKYPAENRERATEIAQLFLDQPPRLAIVTGHHLRSIQENIQQGFTIEESQVSGTATLLLSPDFGICSNCRTDIQGGERRHGYAFTTCTDCGPRYSITKRIPYDRPETTMESFSMCPSCHEEYHDPADRRFYSQTNSCPDCGIKLHLEDHPDLAQEAIVKTVASYWNQGKIVAIKGIGGFLLTCAADAPPAIEQLRTRKHRPDKPLAVMYPDLECIRSAFQLSALEEKELDSPASPIVLLRPKPAAAHDLALAKIASALSRVGIMLPYTPLFQLLLQAFGRPIVATSGNISGEPIVFRSADRGELSSVADHILDHNLEILCPQDDSVVSFTGRDQKIILRRSRGLSPTLLLPSNHLEPKDLMAVGADLKSSFCFHHEGNLYASQYLGDLGSFTAQENYRLTVEHLRNVLGARPESVLHDLHPSYASRQIAEQLAEDWKVPTLGIQHHEGHFAAVLGEHNLLDHTTSILGIIWDGTGYGTDGNIWGGEIFQYQNYGMQRLSHLEYFPHFGGNKLPREPRLAAFAMASSLPEAGPILSKKFTPQELSNYERLITRSRLQSSSMGRLFDAAASLIMGIDYQSYEGMAASRLEVLAEVGLSNTPELTAYPVALAGNGNIPGRHLLRALLQDTSRKVLPEQIAARFHLTLVELIRQLANWSGSKHLAFSGGVFQNALLVQLIEERLSEDYQLHFHQAISPNDENIGFGQLVHYSIQQRAQVGTATKKTTDHVLSYSR